MIRWVFLLLLACAGCSGEPAVQAASSTQAAPMQDPAASGSTVATPDGQLGYRLGADDKVMLTVFGEEALSKEYSVGPNGMMSVPLIGDVRAAGRTVGDVQKEIRDRLADGYLKDPSVSMQISTFRPFFILGEVTRPGQYPYRDGMTVTAAVATAEGFTYRAQKRYVFIKHEGSTEEIRTEVTPGLQVQPGDTIRFGERYF